VRVFKIFWIKLNSLLMFSSIQNQSFKFSKFLNTYHHQFTYFGRDSISVRMKTCLSLCAVLLLTIVLTLVTHQVLDEHNSINHKWLKQGDTKPLKLLNEYLLTVTFEFGENCSIENFK